LTGPAETGNSNSTAHAFPVFEKTFFPWEFALNVGEVFQPGACRRQAPVPQVSCPISRNLLHIVECRSLFFWK